MSILDDVAPYFGVVQQFLLPVIYLFVAFILLKREAASPTKSMFFCAYGYLLAVITQFLLLQLMEDGNARWPVHERFGWLRSTLLLAYFAAFFVHLLGRRAQTQRAAELESMLAARKINEQGSPD